MRISVRLGFLALSCAIVTSAFAHQASAEEAAQPSSWADKISLGADLRIRTEHMKAGGSASDDRWRNRFAGRITMKGKISETLLGTFRLASAESIEKSIRSSNQSFTGASSKKGIFIDLAYVDWTAADHLNIGLGKMPNPFWIAGKQQMVWDSDLTMEGASIKWAADGEMTKFGATLGGFWLGERYDDNKSTATANNEETDQFLAAAQLNGGLKTEAINAMLGVGYFNFTGLKNSNLNYGGGALTPLGPTTVTGGFYEFGFEVLEAGLEIGTNSLGIPVTLYGDWAQNMDPSTNNEGWVGGVRFGKLEDLYSWTLDYNYRDTDANAVVDQFNDSDFGDGGTSQYGSTVKAQAQVAEKTVGTLTYMNAQRDGARALSSAFEERYQLDFTFSF